jgi:hypothetical protein
MRARHTHNKISDIPGNTPLITEMGYTHKGISDIPGSTPKNTEKGQFKSVKQIDGIPGYLGNPDLCKFSSVYCLD